jgi:hypothetical protein
MNGNATDRANHRSGVFIEEGAKVQYHHYVNVQRFNCGACLTGSLVTNYCCLVIVSWNCLGSCLCRGLPGASNNIIVDNTFRNNSFGIALFTNLGGKDPGQYPTADNWFVGNTFVENGAAISIGGRTDNGATDSFFAENTIRGNTSPGRVCH